MKITIKNGEVENFLGERWTPVPRANHLPDGDYEAEMTDKGELFVDGSGGDGLALDRMTVLKPISVDRWPMVRIGEVGVPLWRTAPKPMPGRSVQEVRRRADRSLWHWKWIADDDYWLNSDLAIGPRAGESVVVDRRVLGWILFEGLKIVNPLDEIEEESQTIDT